jgi:preprotein translocase subunit SecE
MTQTLDHPAVPAAKPAPKKAVKNKDRKKGFLGRVLLYVRQVVAELRKVVTPTRSELVRYTLTVIAFVAFMILLVTVLDFAFGWLSTELFKAPPADR